MKHRERLKAGQCPKHGCEMHFWAHGAEQIGGPHDGERFKVLMCPRGGCGVNASTHADGGPYMLAPEFANLLDWEHFVPPFIHVP